jgi:hypothetical protein
MSSDLMDKYLEHIRGNDRAYKLRPSNKANLNRLTNQLGKNSLNTTQDFEVIKKKLLLTLEGSSKNLDEEENRLKKGVVELNNVKEFLADNSKPVDAETTSYPTGFKLEDKDLFSKLQNFLIGEDKSDIDNCAEIMHALFFDKMVYDDVVEELLNEEHMNEEVFKEKMNKQYKDLDCIRPAFRSMLHWPTYKGDQMGIGGPHDIAQFFFDLFFDESGSIRTRILQENDEKVNKLLECSYLGSQLKVLASLIKVEGDSLEVKYNDLKDKLDSAVKLAESNKISWLNMDYDIWFGTGILNGKEDSYVSCFTLPPLLESTDGNKNTVDSLVKSNPVTGLYNITATNWYAKGTGVNELCFFVFSKFGKMDNKPGRFSNTDKGKIVYNLCDNLESVDTNPAHNWSVDKRGAPNIALYQIGAKNIVTGTDKAFSINKEVKVGETMISQDKSGGEKKRKIKRGGYGGFGMPPTRILKQNRSELGGTNCGKSPNLTQFDESFAIYGDRDLMTCENSNVDEYFKNLFKLYEKIKSRKDIDAIINKVGAMPSIPVFYQYDNWNGKKAIPKNMTGALTMEELSVIFAIGNIGVNLGSLLKNVLYQIIVIYYHTGNIINEELRNISNKNNKQKRDITKLKAVHSVLWENLLKKYKEITSVIEETFGTIPVPNTAAPADGVRLAQYFFGISFTTDNKDGNDIGEWVQRMKNLWKIIDECFPFLYEKDTSSTITTLKPDSFKQQITKLLFKLPDYYTKQFLDDTKNNVDISKGVKPLIESRKLLTLGGMALIDPVMEDVKAFVDTLRLAVDSARKSKGTYREKVKILKDDVASQLPPGQKLKIQEGVRERFKLLARSFGLGKLAGRMKDRLDNDSYLISKPEILNQYKQIIKTILVDFCAKKDAYVKKYMAYVDKSINKTEKSIGKIGSSIYSLPNTKSINSNKKKFQELDVEREYIITEVKAVVLSLYRGYVNGLFPLLIVRYTAEKIHNIIFDLENYTLNALTMSSAERRNKLKMLGYSHKVSEDSLIRCITQNIRPDGFNDSYFWKQKEAIFNKMTRTTIVQRGTKVSVYKRIYCVLIIDTKGNKKGRYPTMWLVDLFTLASKNCDISQLDQSNFELIKMADNREEVKNFLNHTLITERKIAIGRNISSSFNLDNITYDDHIVVPFILISDNARTKYSIELLKQNKHVISNKVIHIQESTTPVDIFKQIYNMLLYLPEKLEANMTNVLPEETQKIMKNGGDALLTRRIIWDAYGAVTGGWPWSKKSSAVSPSAAVVPPSTRPSPRPSRPLPPPPSLPPTKINDEKQEIVVPVNYTSANSSSDKKDRANIQYYEITKTDSSVTKEPTSYLISEENVQKGFGWLEDINSVSEMGLKQESVNIF